MTLARRHDPHSRMVEPRANGLNGFLYCHWSCRDTSLGRDADESTDVLQGKPTTRACCNVVSHHSRARAYRGESASYA